MLDSIRSVQDLTQRQLSKREIYASELKQSIGVEHALLLQKITNLISGNV